MASLWVEIKDGAPIVNPTACLPWERVRPVDLKWMYNDIEIPETEANQICLSVQEVTRQQQHLF